MHKRGAECNRSCALRQDLTDMPLLAQEMFQAWEEYRVRPHVPQSKLDNWNGNEQSPCDNFRLEFILSHLCVAVELTASIVLMQALLARHKSALKDELDRALAAAEDAYLARVEQLKKDAKDTMDRAGAAVTLMEQESRRMPRNVASRIESFISQGQ